MAMAALAPAANAGQTRRDKWRYAPPVSTGRVLWAESQHISAPKSRGWRSSQWRYAPWALSTNSNIFR